MPSFQELFFCNSLNLQKCKGNITTTLDPSAAEEKRSIFQQASN